MQGWGRGRVRAAWQGSERGWEWGSLKARGLVDPPDPRLNGGREGAKSTQRPDSSEPGVPQDQDHTPEPDPRSLSAGARTEIPLRPGTGQGRDTLGSSCPEMQPQTALASGSADQSPGRTAAGPGCTGGTPIRSSESFEPGTIRCIPSHASAASGYAPTQAAHLVVDNSRTAQSACGRRGRGARP